MRKGGRQSGVEISRKLLQSLVKRYVENPSESMLESIASAALDYIGHEYRMGAMPGIDPRDINSSIGIKLKKALDTWKPEICAFPSYLRVMVYRSALDCYRHDRKHAMNKNNDVILVNTDMDMFECANISLESEYAVNSYMDYMMETMPDTPLGNVMKAYITCYRKGIPPHPNSISKITGMSLREVMGLLPQVDAWLREDACVLV